MIAKSRIGGRWHRIDGLRANQIVDVQHIRILRVLSAGRSPQLSLDLRTFRLERGEPGTMKDFLETNVGQFGIGHGSLAAEPFELRLFVRSTMTCAIFE